MQVRSVDAQDPTFGRLVAPIIFSTTGLFMPSTSLPFTFSFNVIYSHYPLNYRFPSNLRFPLIFPIIMRCASELKVPLSNFIYPSFLSTLPWGTGFARLPPCTSTRCTLDIY
ncbi:unnamed protein product [Meloidogyne enterolobii]|uniref:Uncharacterized protein n=1 Tax=Meloidogyne enterolobii TaxID=390850 RepID=A0ACB0XWR8_MELEN